MRASCPSIGWRIVSDALACYWRFASDHRRATCWLSQFRVLPNFRILPLGELSQLTGGILHRGVRSCYCFGLRVCLWSSTARSLGTAFSLCLNRGGEDFACTHPFGREYRDVLARSSRFAEREIYIILGQPVLLPSWVGVLSRTVENILLRVSVHPNRCLVGMKFG